MTRALLILVAVTATLPGIARGQSFEVASIKPSAPDEHGATLYMPYGDRFAASNMTLKDLIALAWDKRSFQITGGPAWLNSQRFQLLLHEEVKELPVYTMVVGKNGAKLQTSHADSPQLRGGKAQLTAQKITLSILAAQLGNRLNRSVLDQTGLPGSFDIKLEWTPLDSTPDDGSEN